MSNPEERKFSPEGKFSQLPRSSIRNFAESVVCETLSENIMALLAEDVNYRMRALVASASQYVKHAHRGTLTVDDINRALKSGYSSVVVGHSSSSDPSYSHTEKRDLCDGPDMLFFHQKTEVDLAKVATSTKKHESLPPPQVNLTWGAIEGAAWPPCSFSPPPSETPISPSKKPLPATCVVPEELIAYYNAVTNAILGNDEPSLKLALSDLQKNIHISPLLPNLVNFVSVGVEKLSHDICQLTKLLQTIQSIVINPCLFIGHESYLTLLVQCVFNCVVKQLSVSVNTKLDHWMLRSSAAQLLAKIHRDWASPVNKLYHTTLSKFKDIFKNPQQPFCCHYGAVVGIMAFGIEAMETFLYPHMSSYMIHLNKALSDSSYENIQIRTDAQKVHNVLLDVAIQIMQSYINKVFILPPPNVKVHQTKTVAAHTQFNNADNYVRSGKEGEELGGFFRASPEIIKMDVEHAFEMYKVFYEYFGDSFKDFLPWVPTKHAYIPPKNESIRLFCSPDSDETGEELLEKFYVNDQLESNKRSSGDEQSDEDDHLDANKYEVKNLVTDPACGVKLTISDAFKDWKRTSAERDDNFHSGSSTHNFDDYIARDDLQVSELVNDPASGVKLIIAKRNKKSHRPRPMSVPIEAKKPKIKETLTHELAFEPAPKIWEKRQQVIEFDFSGADPLPLKQRKCSRENPEVDTTYSAYCKWKKNLKITGKRPFNAKKWYHRKIKPVTLTNIL